jgi:hypothetical protein
MGTRQDHENQAIHELRSYGRSLVDTVPSGRTEAVVGRALTAGQRDHRPRSLVVAVATMGLLAISNAGMAAVSDSAAPGDLLYLFDRGYERAGDLFGGWIFGVGDRTEERLAESEVLNLRGETQEAIELLQDELAVASSDEALLLEAIEELEKRGNQGQSNQGLGQPADPGPATPAHTAPGQVNDEGNGADPANPSVTAPGNGQGSESGGSPSDDAPGQNKDNDSKDNPSVTAPGQSKDTTTTVTPGNGNGGNSGNNGQGNNEP